MGDWDIIAGWDASAVRAVGDDLASELKKLRSTEAELRDAATPKEWDGEGAEAAKRSLIGIERGVLHRVEEFAMLRTAVDDAAERIKQLQLAMSDLRDMAKANDLEIIDGTVKPMADARAPEPGAGSPATDPDVKAGIEAHVEQLIRTGLDVDADVNRIDSERERLSELLEKMKSKEGVEEKGAAGYMKELRQVEAKLQALDALTEQVDRGNLIMTLDTDAERVRAAVGIGDIDNADYLSVHTPGMDSAVERNMGRYVDELTETTEYAQRMLEGTGKTAATVVWMDYLPPEGNLSEGPEVLSDDRAEAGAKRLAAELEGIQASRAEDPPERLTAIGHSYGSTTTGIALRQTDAVDAFVSQGSPGWGEGGGAGLHVPKDEQYNLRAAGDDLVAGTGWHGGNPEHYEGVRQLGTQETTADGEPLAGSEGHSGYTSADQQKSTSEYNTAAVMVGRDDLLIDPPPPRIPPEYRNR